MTDYCNQISEGLNIYDRICDGQVGQKKMPGSPLEKLRGILWKIGVFIGNSVTNSTNLMKKRSALNIRCCKIKVHIMERMKGIVSETNNLVTKCTYQYRTRYK